MCPILNSNPPIPIPHKSHIVALFCDGRNLLVYWAAAFYRSSTNAPTVDFDPLLIHSQFCEEPCRWQEVLPPFKPSDNAKYFYPDSMPIPDCSEWAPILGYGSLRQLRATRDNALNSDKFGEDMTLQRHVFPRDTRPLRLANNGIPTDYRSHVLCPATEASCDALFGAAPRFAPVFPRVDRSNEYRKDLINDYNPNVDNQGTDLPDEQLQTLESEGTDSLREPPSPPWRSDEYKRNPFYNMVRTL